MKISLLLAPALGVLAVAVIVAQPRGQNPPFPGFAGASGQRRSIVTNEVKHDVSPAVRDMDEAATIVADSEEDEAGEADLRHPSQSRNPAPMSVDTALQQWAGPLVATSPGLNFDGQTATSSSWLEPDTNGAVGATQFVQWTNVSFAVYDKTSGALVKGPVLGNTLWKGFGGPCETKNSGDPIAQYDKAAGRWVMMQHATPGSGPYYMCVAVSTTSDATGTFNRYAFSLPNDFPDYPKIGVWPDAYYISMDMAKPGNWSLVGPYVCALNRNSMLAGLSATSQCFQLASKYLSLLPSDLDGSTPPPAGSPNYLVNLGANSLNIWQFHVDFSNPSNTTLIGPTSIPVATFSQACGGAVCIPQLGTHQQLDSLGDRVMYRLGYRNFGDHEALVVNHSIVAGSSVGVRWYEIRSPGNPVIYQQGTYAPDSNYRWMGSIAIDKVGDIAVGYSVSSSTMNPSISFTGRVPSDPLGTLESEASIMDGTGSQTAGVNRWGDYSAMTVDPIDDCTFWYTNEYLRANGTKNWHTRIASFKFTTCQ
jgi:hypothetical protein